MIVPIAEENMQIQMLSTNRSPVFRPCCSLWSAGLCWSSYYILVASSRASSQTHILKTVAEQRAIVELAIARQECQEAREAHTIALERREAQLRELRQKRERLAQLQEKVERRRQERLDDIQRVKAELSKMRQQQREVEAEIRQLATGTADAGGKQE